MSSHRKSKLPIQSANMDVVDLTQEEVTVMRLHINQCPTPKPSMANGVGRGGPKRTYLCSGTRKKMNQFAHIVKTAAEEEGFKMIPRNDPVSAKVWCFLPRPKTDFKGKERERGLKDEALTLSRTAVTIKPDADNLAKFMLDALTGVLFEDDAQLVDLHMLKLRDSEGLCEGRVAIEVGKFDKDIGSLLPQF